MEEHADDMVVTKFQVLILARTQRTVLEIVSELALDHSLSKLNYCSLFNWHQHDLCSVSAVHVLSSCTSPGVSTDALIRNVSGCEAEWMLWLRVQGPIAGTAMRRSIQGMLEELEYNLWEHILCRLVDYGHTFSPEVPSSSVLALVPQMCCLAYPRLAACCAMPRTMHGTASRLLLHVQSRCVSHSCGHSVSWPLYPLLLMAEMLCCVRRLRWRRWLPMMSCCTARPSISTWRSPPTCDSPTTVKAFCHAPCQAILGRFMGSDTTCMH